jgi:hypothetical protein
MGALHESQKRGIERAEVAHLFSGLTPVRLRAVREPAELFPGIRRGRDRSVLPRLRNTDHSCVRPTKGATAIATATVIPAVYQMASGPPDCAAGMSNIVEAVLVAP